MKGNTERIKLISDNNKYFPSFFQVMWPILDFIRFFPGNLRAIEKPT